MHPTVVYSAQAATQILPWLWTHRKELGPTCSEIFDRVQYGLQGSGMVVDRLGPALVSVSNGQTEVLGLLHRQSENLGQVTLAVDHILTGQQALAGSLNLLNSLSMISLGLSAFSHGILMIQLSAINKRMKTIAGQLKEIKAMLASGHEATLKAGLDQLATGADLLDSKPNQAEQSLMQAIGDLTRSRATFAGMLEYHSSETAPEAAWLASRQLATSALGECAAQLHLNRLKQADNALGSALVHLRRHAMEVFQRTVQSDPTRFLMPMMAGHGITLESLAELYRQASLAGIVGPESRISAAEFFESIRTECHHARDPLVRKSKVRTELINKWMEASAAIEEVNRISGLQQAITAYTTPNRPFHVLISEITKTIEERQSTPGTCFAVFPDRRGNPNHPSA